METEIDIQIPTDTISGEEILSIVKEYSHDLDIQIEDFNGVYNIFDLIKTCSARTRFDPSWGILGGRILLEQIRRTAGRTFSHSVFLLHKQMHPDFALFVEKNKDILDSIPDEEFSKNRQCISVATCLKSYLLRYNKCNGCGECKECDRLWVGETIEQMYMRIATFLFMPDIKKIRELYTALSKGYLSMATPTMFNAGTLKPQMASCFVATIPDSLHGIQNFWVAIGEISRNAGGLGCDFGRIRHSLIGSVGKSDGIPALLPTYQSILQYVDQSKKRKGSMAVFTPIWHIDIETVIKMKDPKGADTNVAKCLDLSYAVWANDLFFERVQKDESWSLFCPKKCPLLTETWGDDFRRLYLQYEESGKARHVVGARELLKEIINAQFMTGMPYILNADQANACSMQDNIGIIRSSNLCAEILLHTSDKEIASCNLCSLCLPAFVNDKVFDIDKFQEITRLAVQTMENVVERNYYPDRETEMRLENRKMVEDILRVNGIIDPDIRRDIAKVIVESQKTCEVLPFIRKANLANRPLGIGLQGFGDMIAKMDYLFDSEEAMAINNQIIQHLYYYSVDESANIASILGPYERFPGSPYSRGILHPDKWVSPSGKKAEFLPSLDWNLLREKVKKGVRHSTLIALMPTATSSIIAGNSPSLEPINVIIGTKTILSGQHVVLSIETYNDLKKLGVWTPRLVEEIISGNNGKYENENDVKGIGGISHLEIPPEIKDNPIKRARFRYIQQKYRTAYEIPTRVIIDQAVARTPFVCQSQSLNLWLADPSVKKSLAIYNYAWKEGLKTLVYYVRGTSAIVARNVTSSICRGDSCSG